MRYAILATVFAAVLCAPAVFGIEEGGILCTSECSNQPGGAALRHFGVPYIDLPGVDASTLPENYQRMIERLLQTPEADRPPLTFCFAEGTDPAIVNAVSQALYGQYGNPLDYQANSRWSTTANGSTGSQGNPIILTYSFVPDGVSIPPGAGEPTSANTLFATMNGIFGSPAVWQAKFQQVFDRWSELTGITYVATTDDGASFPGSAGVLGVRGDVRIASHPIDGNSNVLAFNYFPNTGDMVLDNAESWGSSSNDFRWLRNTVSHEHGHGIGLNHVCPDNGTKLMEPFLNTGFDGPQHDDIRGGQRHYGDTYENNDANTTAYDMGTLGNGTATLTNLSSDDNSDIDWYKFTVASNKQATVTLTPVGLTYTEGPQNQNCDGGTSNNTIDDQNLNLELYSTNGTVLIATAPAQPAGTAEVISNFALPGAGTYHVKINSGTSNVVQLYSLSVLIANAANSITVSAPNGGETWYVGETRAITWSSSGVSGNVRIELNRTYPSASWESLNSNTANDGTENYTVAGAVGANCRMRIISINTPSIGDTSDSNFAISNPTLTVTSPNGGEFWFIGESHPITWSSVGLTGNINIELSRNGGGVWESVIANTANDGTHSWTHTGPATTQARIRVTASSNPAITDLSDQNFTISDPIIQVDVPNGGETWYIGSLVSVNWTTFALTGNVKIELNRNYPVGVWETLFTSIINDGTESWTVTGGTSAALARIRITSVTQPTISDVSNGNFTISNPVVTVTRPNGGETLDGLAAENVTWTSAGFSGNVTIEVNRDYPAGAWNLITTVPNSGSYGVVFGGPPTNTARVRIASVNSPVATDISNSNFSISVPNTPPLIVHDPKGDAAPGNVIFTALVTDDFSTPNTVLNWRVAGGGAFSPVAMASTGNPNEFSAALNLAENSYDYYISSADLLLLTSQTDTFNFEVGSCAFSTLSYDDGSAEGFNWSQTDSFEWAVRVQPPQYPYMLCEVQIAIAAISPEPIHSEIQVNVYNADGPGGMPGTLLWSETSGSIGNEVGGTPPEVLHWAKVLIKDPNGSPLNLVGEFYVSVENPVPGRFEAFGRDDHTPWTNSYFYDGCDLAWFSENSGHENAFGGQRMIRLIGSSLAAPAALVIRASGNNIVLNWNSSGSAFYRIYSANNPAGPFTTFEGSTSATTFTDVGAVGSADKLFYVVVSSTTP